MSKDAMHRKVRKDAAEKRRVLPLISRKLTVIQLIKHNLPTARGTNLSFHIIYIINRSNLIIMCQKKKKQRNLFLS